MKVLLVSDDPAARASMELLVRGLSRITDRPIDFLEARDAIVGAAVAWRHRPDVVVADEICSRAGAFALARDLKGAEPAFPGALIVLLERPQDAWLASWSGADAWFVKPVNPFEVADRVVELVRGHSREAV